MIGAIVRRLGKAEGPERQGLLSALLNAAASTLDLVGFVLVARILPTDTLGVFLIAVSIGTIAEIFGPQVVSQTIMRSAIRAVERDQPGDLRLVIRLGVGMDVAFLILAVVAAWFTAKALVAAGDIATFAGVVLAVLLGPSRFPLTTAALPRAFAHHAAVVGWLAVGAMLKVLMLFAVLHTGGGLLTVVLAFLVWRLTPAVAGLRIMLKEAGRLGVWATPASHASEFTKRHADFWRMARTNALVALPKAAIDLATPLIGAQSGAVTAGLYRLATKIGEAARIYTNPASLALYADQIRAVGRADFRTLWRRTVVWSSIFGVLTACGAGIFSMFGDWLVLLAFGADYLPAVPAVLWCIVAAVPTSMATPVQFALQSIGAPRGVFVSELGAACLFLGILIVLQSPTAYGAAVALAAGRALGLVLAVSAFHIALSGKLDLDGPRRTPT